MTPQEIEKAAEAWADNPEHRHKHKIWMRPSHIDAYKSGANLVMERVSVLEKQLRVAVEIVEIAKAFVHQEKGNICGRCDTEDHKYGWACRFSAALQKIEAMKGGKDG